MKAFDGFRELFRKLFEPIKSEIGKISKIILNNHFSFFLQKYLRCLIGKKGHGIFANKYISICSNSCYRVLLNILQSLLYLY